MKAIRTTLHGRWFLALLVLALLLPGIALIAQRQGVPKERDGVPKEVEELQEAVAALTKQVQALQSSLNSQGQSIDGLRASVADHSNKLQFVTVVGTEMYVTGANLNIRDVRRAVEISRRGCSGGPSRIERRRRPYELTGSGRESGNTT